jgi:uncharacterized cupredoxin-like copper-binding protein
MEKEGEKADLERYEPIIDAFRFGAIEMKQARSRLFLSSVLVLTMVGVFILVNTVLSGQANGGQAQNVITIRAANMRFDRDTITVKIGQPVTIRLENDDTMEHAFAVNDLDVLSDLVEPRQVTEVTFTPQQVGSFQFVCPFPGHAQYGMVGMLEVVA